MSSPVASSSPSEPHSQYGPPSVKNTQNTAATDLSPTNASAPAPAPAPVAASSSTPSSPPSSDPAYYERIDEAPSSDLATAGVDEQKLGKSEAVTNPYDELTKEPQQQQGRTFLTGVDSFDPSSSSSSLAPLSDSELIAHIEKQMLEYERTAQYVEAEKARQHLEAVKKRAKDSKKLDLSRIQEEDIRVFFSMVGQHQENFDRIWTQKTLEHKLRADDLIDQLKWKHDDQQRELYEQLRKKRMPKFSVELLNMRKRQVLLAKAKNYIEAEKIKRKADMLEAVEIERIRESAREENQLRFQALLKKQEWDRKALAQKLKIEKKGLLEAKAQDFLRLKKRLRNAEQELKKTHIRQQLLAEKKLVPVYSVQHYQGNASGGSGNLSGSGSHNLLSSQSQSSSLSSTGRGSALRNSGRQRLALSGTAGPPASTGAAAAGPSGALSARELTNRRQAV